MEKTQTDMTSGEGMLKKLILFVSPIMLSGILQLLFTTSDLVVCRYFGSEHSVGAISSTNALTNLIVNSFMGLSIGANILLARCFGADDRKRGQSVVYTSLILSAVMGLLLGILGVTCSRYFLLWMKTNPEVIDLSTQYLRIYFLGVPFTMIYNFGAALLRAVGETKRPFWFLTASGVINAGLNVLLVTVFHLDVAGVAIATSVSQLLAAAMVIVYIRFMKQGFFEFRFGKMTFSAKEALEITRVGLPAGLQGAIFSISNVMIQVGVNDLSTTLGTALVDGNGAAVSLGSFVYTAMNSCAQGVITFGSANYGAKNKANIKKVILYSLLIVLAVWAVPSGLILLLNKPLLGIYVSNAEAVAFGRQRLFLVIGTYFLCGFMDVFAYALRSIGYSVLPTVVSIVGVCGLRLLWIFCIFPIPFFYNLTGLMVAYPASWIPTLLTHLICFFALFRKLHFTEEPNGGMTDPPLENANESD